MRAEMEITKNKIPYTVRKMGLILRSIERMLKMQFSLAVSLRSSRYADMT
jgi:hypothetical protein